jgi:D-alanyl-D-alanine carboxypeptidase
VTFTTRQVADAAALARDLLRLNAIYHRVPGVAFGLSHGNETVLLGAVGVRDVASGAPVDPATTAFRCASITKSFTATVVLQCVDRGVLRLDDPVAGHLPWARRALDGDLTVRDLLMHSGGILRDGSNAWDGATMPDRATLRAEVKARASFAQPLERFRYSNVAYSLLGEVLTAVTGRSFESLVRSNVVRRLALSTTWPDLTPAARRALATGYGAARPGEERPALPHVQARAVAPAGGLVSTVPDLLAYQQAHLPGDPRLLTEHAKREMQRPQWLRDDEPHYGLGWMVWTIGGIHVVGHSGGFPGFITKIGFAPAEGLAAAVLTNANSAFASVGLELLYGAVAGVGSLWAPSAAATRWHTRGSLGPFAGVYRNRGHDLVIARVNGALYLCNPEDPAPLSLAARLDPIGRRRFVIASGDDFGYLGEELAFEVDGRGRPRSFNLGANVAIREQLA